MSLIGSLAAEGLNLALGTALKATPVDAATIASVMTMTGNAMVDLAGKLKDGKIDEAEIEDTLAKVGAMGNDSVALSVKAAIGRILEHIL
jgi:hypothetical protein